MKLRAFHIGCHGIPERCFKVRGNAMPFCARCFGASIGHLTGISVCILLKTISWQYFSVGVMIMLADWTLQNKFNIYHCNVMRFLTGIFGGFSVAGFIVFFIRLLLAWADNVRWFM